MLSVLDIVAESSSRSAATTAVRCALSLFLECGRKDGAAQQQGSV
jgi:hypothetical protein